MGTKATMLDVARVAGVALGTVSNHLNGSVHVSAKTAQKIDKAIARLGYRIHLGARSLRSQRTQTVGSCSPASPIPSTPRWRGAVENALWERGYQMLLCYSALDEDRERMHLDTLESRTWTASSHPFGQPPYERLKRSSVPVVCLDRVVEGQLSVATDNLLGGWLAARHLVALGHRRIAVLAGQITYNSRTPSASFQALSEMAAAEGVNVRERLQGFIAVLRSSPGWSCPRF